MSRLRSLVGQSPAIAIATLALVLSFVGGATAATVSGHGTKAQVVWHQLTLTNGWKYGGFGSAHAAYYIDAIASAGSFGRSNPPRNSRPARAAFLLPCTASPAACSGPSGDISQAAYSFCCASVGYRVL